MEIFRSEDLKDLLEKQYELNEKYNGKNWERVGEYKFKVAILTEYAELMESSPENWKWWRKNLENDVQNQYIELVDILHFAMSYMMLTQSIDSLVEWNIDLEKDYDLFTVENVDNTVPLVEFLQDPDLENFYLMLNSICVSLGLDFSKQVEIYKQKNKLNHTRVDGGYMKGEYDKTASGEEDNRQIDV